MTPLFDLVQRGGPAMIAIVVLSIVLYSRCFKLLLSLRSARREFSDVSGSTVDLPEIRRRQAEMRESFRQHRVALSAMIAAAPLLGLLGTVSGMEKTFQSLAERAGDKSMEGLARGISEVLVATESGLLVALPALVIVYIAHREVHKYVERLNQIGRLASGGPSS